MRERREGAAVRASTEVGEGLSFLGRDGVDRLSGELIAEARARIAARLDELVPPETAEPRGLHHAVRYSLMAPGKRVRPVLALLSAAALGGSEQDALDPACAIEMVHAASLILDDLPSMDDATLRRGLPANHRVHGEAIATLAAIALLNRAYGVIAEAPRLPARERASLVTRLSRAVGSEGAVAGQCRDLEIGTVSDLETLREVEGLKTATLFVAAAETGAIVAGLEEEALEPVRRFGWNLGLAFQVRDDWLDAAATREEAGKDVRQDEGRTTLVSLLGTERAGSLLEELLASASSAIAPLGPGGRALARVCRGLLTGP